MIHQCPKCELRFDWKTELDDHCRQDHPEFRHDYPVHMPPPVEEVPAPQAHEDAAPAHTHIDLPSGLISWLVPNHSPHGNSVPPEPGESVREER